MRCILLKTPGELVEGETQLKELGFSVTEVQTTKDMSSLLDTRAEEFEAWTHIPTQRMDKPYVRSLRASFANMLESYADDPDDLIIFGESDATPNIDAARVKSLAEEALSKHPGLDVLRLHFRLVEYAEELTTPIDVRLMPQYDSYSDVNYCWGTHAMIIPAAKRLKVARLFRECKLPIDVTLEACNSLGELTVGITMQNVFYQKKRTAFPDIKSIPGYRERNLAVCITSYKRPESVIKQIYAFLNQTYNADRYHLFVAVKGLPEYLFNRLIVSRFDKFVKEGRLTLRYCTNKSQLSNFLDCIRDTDISAYDLILKVDDDDFYADTYLEAVNAFHATISETSSSSLQGYIPTVHAKDSIPATAVAQLFEVMGASFAMTRSVIEKLRRAEKDPEYKQAVWQSIRNANKMDIRVAEDQLMCVLMQKEGTENRLPFLNKHKQYTNHITVNSMSQSSATRGSYILSAVAEGRVEEEMLLSVAQTNYSSMTLQRIGNVVRDVDTGDTGMIQKEQDNVAMLIVWKSGTIHKLAKTTAGLWLRQEVKSR